MRRLRATLALLLLALWVPASSHGLLERIGWIHTDHGDCDSSTTDSDHDAADGNCVTTQNQIDVPQPDLSGSPSPVASVELWLVLTELVEASVTPNGPDPPGTAPPGLSHTWQFSFRASLPPRAPSLMS